MPGKRLSDCLRDLIRTDFRIEAKLRKGPHSETALRAAVRAVSFVANMARPWLGFWGIQSSRGVGRAMQLANGNEVVTPTKDDAALAREVGQKLAAYPAGELRLELKTESSTEELVLPPAARRLLVRALAELGE